MDFNEFKVSHLAQLKNIPEKYWDALFEKLSHEVGPNQSRNANETYQNRTKGIRRRKVFLYGGGRQ